MKIATEEMTKSSIFKGISPEHHDRRILPYGGSSTHKHRFRGICPVLITMALLFTSTQTPAQTNFFWTNGMGGTWSAQNWTNELKTTASPVAGGSNAYVIMFATNTTFTSTNNLGNNNFQLNLLGFSNSAVTITGSNLVFVANPGAGFPRIVHDGTTAVDVVHNVVLSNNTILTGIGGGTLVITNISGTGSLSNSFNGTFEIGGVNIMNGSTITLNNALTRFTSDTAGNSNVAWNIVNSSGTLLFDTDKGGANKSIQLGTLSGVAGSVLRAAGNQNGVTTFVIGERNANSTFSGTITNSDNPVSLTAITKTGPGTLTLDGLNTYSATTLVSCGTLTIRTASALGDLSAGTTVIGANAFTGSVLSLSSASGNLTVAEPLTLQCSATGRARLINAVGTNTYSGNIAVSPNSSHLAAVEASAGAPLTITGDISGDFSNATFFVRGAGDGIITGNINITGGGGLSKTDAGTWTVGVPGKTYNWGNTLVAVGILRAGTTNVLPASTILTIGQNDGSSPIFDLNGFDQTVGGLALTPGTGGIKQISNLGSTPATLSVYCSGNYTFGGTINNPSNTLSLVKGGGGMLALTGTNTYTGSTKVESGVLKFGTGNIGTTPDLTINAGSTAIVETVSNATIANSGSVRINSGGFLYLTGGVNETIGYMYFDGMPQLPGTWGSSASTATYKDDTRFGGAGIVTVLYCDTHLYSNVPESTNYTVLYNLSIPAVPNWGSTPVSYSVDNSTNIIGGTFSRIAYYMELIKSGGATQWVYVSMDSFADDPSKLGVPTVASGEYYQYVVTGPITNANIYSSESSITTGTVINTINLEFWPSNYGGNNDYGVPNASNTWDFGDGGSGTGQGYGSMQIHNYGALQTLFAYNNWNGGGTCLGIGNQVGGSGNPDWTFQDNAGTYLARTLQVLVLVTTTNNNGSWAADASGTWGTASNWLDSVVAFGKSMTANFTNAITADRIVTNNFRSRGIGNMTFGSPNGYDWTMKQNTILLTSDTTPTITVKDHTVNMKSVLDGTQGFIKEGAGTLVIRALNTYSGATVIDYGTIKLGYVGAMYEGSISQSGINTVSPNPATGVTAIPRLAYSNVKPPWSDNVTWIYTGCFDNDSTNSVTWTFGESIDDNTYLTIDGLIVLNNGSWNIPTIANYTLTPGVHPFDLRMYNGGGGCGWVNTSWWSTNGMGVAYDPQGRNAQAIGNYQPMDASIFAMLYGGLPTNTALYVSGNGILDLAGAPQLVGSLSDYSGLGGIVTNSTSIMATLTVGRNNSSTAFSGIICGSNSLSKTGTGTLTLGGSNSYLGCTTINQGTLILSPNGTFGPSPTNVTVNAGTQLLINRTNNQIFAQGLLGTGTVTMELGGSVLTFTGEGSFNGPIVVSNGTLLVSGTGTVGGSNVTVEADAQIVIENSSKNVLNDSATVVLKTGGSGGKIYLTNGVIESIGNLYFDGIKQAEGTWGSTASGAMYTDNSRFAGSGMLDVGGQSGSWSLGGDGTWSTGVNWTNGTIPFGGGATAYFTNAIGADCTVTYDYSRNIIGNLVFGSPGGYNWILTNSCFNLQGSARVTVNTNTATIASAITGNAGLTKLGTGTLVLCGTNNYSGSTIITNGILKVAGDTALPGTTADMFVYSTFDLNGFSNTVRNLWGGRAAKVTCGASSSSTIAVSNNIDDVFQGLIENGSGTVSFVKYGAGNFTFAGKTQTYTGLTTVAQGTLTLSSSLAPSTPLHIGASGTVKIPSGSPGLKGEYYNVPPANVGNSNPNFATLDALNAHLSVNTPSVTASSFDAGAYFEFGRSNPNTLMFPAPYNSGSYGNWEARWSGQFMAPVSGLYTFYTGSDDCSMLFIDGNTVVNNNYFQGWIERYGTVTLSAGMHDIVACFCQGGGDYGMNASVTIPGSYKQVIPNALLSFGNVNIGSLSGDTGSSLVLGSTQIMISQATDKTFAGIISGSDGILVKAGTANLNLTGQNTFSGSLLIYEGTLSVNGSMAATNIVASTNNAMLSGTGIVSGTVSAYAGGAISPAGTNAVGTLTIKDLSLGNGAAINWTYTNNSPCDLVAVTNQFTTAPGDIYTIRLYNPGLLPAPSTQQFTVVTWSPNAPVPDTNVIWIIEKPAGGGAEGWAPPQVRMETSSNRVVIVFPKAGSPAVDNGPGASNVTARTAVLNGNYTATGTTAWVSIYWGTSDGGTNKGAWTNVYTYTSQRGVGQFSLAISNLYYGYRYSYRCYASNSVADYWFPATSNFTVVAPVKQLDGIRGSIFRNLPNNDSPQVLTDAPYSISCTRTFTGGHPGNLLGMDEDPSFNVVVTGQVYATSNPNTYPTLFPGFVPVDQFASVFSGRFIPRISGTHKFRWDCDDRGMMYIDLNGDGVFQPGDAVVATPQWGANGTVDLNADQEYNFIFSARDYGGDSTVKFYLTEPYQSETNVNSVSQKGMWKCPIVDTLLAIPASVILTNSAMLNAMLAASGEVYSVHVFWGTNNCLTNAGSWVTNAFVGVFTNEHATTGISYPVAGLTPDTTYYYTFRATNALSTVWADTVRTFKTCLVPSTCSNRMKLTFSGYDRAETLNGFPALVVLGEHLSGFLYSQFQPQATDLRFLDATASYELSYEIEQWNTNGKSYVWVRVPELVDDYYIWVYWGSASSKVAPSYTIDGSTWQDGYSGVWHLGQTNSLGHCSDSTANACNGIEFNDISMTTGLIGNAQRFGGNNSYISIQHGMGANTTNSITLMALAKSSLVAGQYQALVTERFAGDSTVQFELWCENDLLKAGFYRPDLNWRTVNELAAFRLDQWTLAAATYDGNSIRLYRDGVEVAESASLNYQLPVGTNGWFIGHRHDGSGAECWNGVIDEVRVSSIARSSNWIWACWMNQLSNDVFNVYTPVSGIINGSVSNITSRSAQFRPTLYNTGTVTEVIMYWGETDGGTNAAAWEKATSLGSYTTGTKQAIDHTLTRLDPDTVYYFRFRAPSTPANGWAGISGTFKTLVTELPLSYRMNVTFKGYNKNETLTNFPALIVLNESITNFFYRTFKPGGKDIRFTDAGKTRELNYEIDDWNSNGNSYVWVQLPILTNNYSIWAYWGVNPDATNILLPCTTNGITWPTDYTAVWHLGSTNSNGTIPDATAYRRYGVTTTGLTFNAGLIGKSWKLNGIDERAYIEEVGVHGSLPRTLYGWAKAMSPEPIQYTGVFGLQPRTGNGNLKYFDFECDNYGPPRRYCLQLYSVEYGQTTMDTNWHFFAASYDNPAIRIYIDGTLITTVNNGSLVTEDRLIMGNRVDSGTFFEGYLDEIRVANVTRSSNWIWACWMNQNPTNFSSFVSLGPVRQTGKPGSMIMIR